MWRNQDSGLMTYSLALLNNVAYNVVEFAKSQVRCFIKTSNCYHNFTWTKLFSKCLTLILCRVSEARFCVFFVLCCQLCFCLQVEWMSDKIMKSLEDQRNNPFQFKYIQICHSLADLNKVPEPKACLELIDSPSRYNA